MNNKEKINFLIQDLGLLQYSKQKLNKIDDKIIKIFEEK